MSDMTAVLMPEVRDGDVTIGHIVEYAETEQDLHEPRQQAHRGVRDREGGLAMAGGASRVPRAAARARAGDAVDHRPCERRARPGDRGGPQRDTELAVMVIEGDDRIDGRYLDVHQGILSLLARQSPVASDLRLVAALLHTIMHIERVGDLAVNIAKLVPLMGEAPERRRRDHGEARGRREPGPRPAQAGADRVRAAQREPGREPRQPGRRDRLAQPPDLPGGGRDRRQRPARARVGRARDADRALPRAHRRPHRRHRRADRVRDQRGVPRVHGRLAPERRRA